VSSKIDVLEAVIKRNAELFGYIAAQKSSLRLIRSDIEDIMIVSCKLEALDRVLSTVALIYPPMLVTDMSGSLKRLRRRLNEIALIV
jgi:RNase P/RNase MRP subunit POP5